MLGRARFGVSAAAAAEGVADEADVGVVVESAMESVSTASGDGVGTSEPIEEPLALCGSGTSGTISPDDSVTSADADVGDADGAAEAAIGALGTASVDAVTGATAGD